MNFAPSRPNKTNSDKQDDNGLLGVSWNETLRDVESGIKSIRLAVCTHTLPEEDCDGVYTVNVTILGEGENTTTVEKIRQENAIAEETEGGNITVEDTRTHWIIKKEDAKLTVFLTSSPRVQHFV